ncbi:MAG: hypothetical protein GXO24_06915 [Chlorobi bacterium]|nr:hypothetical protein [Chlorobiota bacterium]
MIRRDAGVRRLYITITVPRFPFYVFRFPAPLALRVGFARGGGAICAEALPKLRPRNAGGQRGAAIPRRVGKRWNFGVGKPQAPDESKAEHIQAETPTRGLARGHEEGTRPHHKNQAKKPVE